MQWKLESRMISDLISRRRSIWNQREGRTEKNAVKVGLNLKRRQGSDSSGRNKSCRRGKGEGVGKASFSSRKFSTLSKIQNMKIFNVF